ncbi:MAG: TonB-dependent receptor plug domain-containing protein, partial [Gammaproteobacteria bacterium]
MFGSLVWVLSAIFLAIAPGQVFAHEEEEVTELDTLTVTGRADDLSGIAESSNQGRVGQAQLRTRPILRSGELLEIVPGAVVTQHSGTGKANQYFLRGFNLDHGTDFNARIDGVPLNLPSHGHGQGYLDINPIIPELVNYFVYGMWPYYAFVGDFSSAGYAHYLLYDELD